MGAVLVWGNPSSQFYDAVSLSLLRYTEPGEYVNVGWTLTEKWELGTLEAPLPNLQNKE